MTSRFSFFSILLCLIISIGPRMNPVAAREESLPFLAETTSDEVNVRAGQSTSFERVDQLRKGEEVLVVGKEFSWYKIQLPASSHSYLNKQYVRLLGPSAGRGGGQRQAGGITADRVNIRAGADIHFSILGQLTKGEQIYILEDKGEWYRIEPVAESYGWVDERFLTFKSHDVAGYRSKLSPRPSLEFKPQVAVAGSEPEIKEKRKEEEKAPSKEKLPVPKTLTLVGNVEVYEYEGKDDIHYKIIVDGKVVGYIQGRNHLLGRFLHRRVRVEGDVNQELYSLYPSPVITVSKVRLML
jgi:SH3-like domain-containing protein